MKLINAKCPNCGANLNVNPKQDAMKCEYCRSAILIEEAIEKYKLEISAQIEVVNLPKVDNYLRLAERHYNDKDYEEAYKLYNSVIELEPDNTFALLRFGICKTLINNYIDFNLDYLINTINNVASLLNDDRLIEKYAEEIICAIDISLEATKNYYNSYNITESDLYEIQDKLISIVNCYELIIDLAPNKKDEVANKIVIVLKEIIKDKDYKTGQTEFGVDVMRTYKLNSNIKTTLNNKLNYYLEILNLTSQKNTIKEISETKDTVNIRIIIADVFLIILIVGAISNLQLISAVIMAVIFLIITSQNISNLWFNDKNERKKCIVLLIIVLIITMMNGI